MYLGIDIGGTKTLLAVLDDNGQIVEQTKFPTAQDYQAFIQNLGQALQSFQNKNFSAAAAGIPGRINRQSGVVHALGNLPWRDESIRDDIASFTHCPVIIENDAKTAGLSEAMLVINNYRRVLYFTISTGIGGGFIVGGAIDLTLQDMEIGQMLFPHDGKLMRWETFASGKAIFERYGKKASDIDDPATWQTIAENLGLGVFAGCTILQPEVIIFGGGVGAHFDKFSNQLQAFVDQNWHSVIEKPALLQAKHAEEAVIYGCYELAKHAHGQLDS